MKIARKRKLIIKLSTRRAAALSVRSTVRAVRSPIDVANNHKQLQATLSALTTTTSTKQQQQLGAH